MDFDIFLIEFLDIKICKYLIDLYGEIEKQILLEIHIFDKVIKTSEQFQ